MPTDLVFIVVAALAFVAVAGAGLALSGGGGDKARKQRLQAAVGATPGRVQARRGAAQIDPRVDKRRQIQGTLKEMEERQKALRKKALTLGARIEQAGLDWTPTRFWILSAILGGVAGFLALLFAPSILLVPAAAAVAGLGVPRWILGFLKASRLKKFTLNFADALDVIVRGIKSGLPLNECLKIIAREAENPVRKEFQTLVEGVSVGVDADEGLRRMMQRVPLPELSFFAIVLAIQGKSGGNLAEALGNLSSTLRARKLMRERVAALSSEAKASALIIGSLPFIVVVMISFIAPDYMAPLFTTSMGRLMILGGLCWMGIGVFVMRGMINFKM